MILHTVIDPMEVMGSVPPQFVWKKIDGGLLQIRKDMTGGETVERIFSTDPAVYLKKAYQPGVGVFREKRR
ncbi:MAG: hypothetical protein IIX70_01280 [Oscillospiraceae bacterium]|nr:hypothetical protein [Oscillospiraceae bacterium]MBQ7082188.1 hypothetical protein [Oscillospiraceae bacterium]